MEFDDVIHNSGTAEIRVILGHMGTMALFI